MVSWKDDIRKIVQILQSWYNSSELAMTFPAVAKIMRRMAAQAEEDFQEMIRLVLCIHSPKMQVIRSSAGASSMGI
ncbi:hypothetical protein BOTNAR_0326g00070 [Botryotinia narcissicola]|uniref:HAT C-terminal dimerisation domain-containing protein n=1 Tax=Botryotinia narcissicola TaxID=278944 RepID=A0A4Z1HUD8_9HELO|nr:hypothetical protein BOTNAR_0326g00070 [Botryotinia narcissicola]